MPRAKLFFHHHPVRFIGVGPMGHWFEHVLTGWRFLMPSGGEAAVRKGWPPCFGTRPTFDLEECDRCGYKRPRIVKLADL